LEAAPGPELSSYAGGPSSAVLRDRDSRAGFPLDLHEDLAADVTLVSRVARSILDTHFPPSLHDDIAGMVGLSLGAGDGAKRTRDPGFRMRVLNAYSHRCAVCGFGARLDGQTQGVEAGHVRWHSHDGPDEVANGLALCSLHHKVFDLGLITLDESHKLVVSSRVSGEGVESALFRFANQALARPVGGKQCVAPEHIEWHRQEVFKGEAG